MIGLMSIVALVAGILFSLLYFSKEAVSWVFIVLYTTAYTTKVGFYELYDMADDKISYDLYKGHSEDIKKYSDYLKLHAEARPSAYKTFRTVYDIIAKSLFLKIIPITFAPAILFWSNWYFYALGVVIAIVSLVGYGFAKNGFRPGFYQRMAIFNAMSVYRKKSK